MQAAVPARSEFQALPDLQANSSIGRASVSKTEGWGFEALLACHY